MIAIAHNEDAPSRQLNLVIGKWSVNSLQCEIDELFDMNEKSKYSRNRQQFIRL